MKLKINNKHLLIPLFVFCFVTITSASDEWVNPLVRKLDSMTLELKQKLNSKKLSKTVFDIQKYGAIGDGKTICTSYIQKAIDDCSRIGGGRVLIANGKYITGTLVIKDNVELHIEKSAVLIGSSNLEDYQILTGDYRNNTDRQVNKSLIYAHKVSNISLTGQGSIDFNGGAEVFKTGVNNDLKRPFGIRFISCKNILIESLFLTNSAQWLQHYLNCENVRINKIKVYNHVNQNNDGIDIDGSHNVLMTDCVIDSDDDGICLKSNGVSSCENVLIENCIASSHCNALKLGTETTGGFKNVIMRNCRVKLSKDTKHINGVDGTESTLTLIITDGGLMKNILIQNIDAKGPITAICITLGNRMRPYTLNAPPLKIGTISNIKIKDFTSTGAGPVASSITGLNGDNMLKNISLENIKLEYSTPSKKLEEITDIELRNAKMNETITDEFFQKAKKKYPGWNQLGNLPVYGLYFRYIEGLTLKNISLKLSCHETRPPSSMIDCKNIFIDGFKLISIDKSSHIIKFDSTKNVFN